MSQRLTLPYFGVQCDWNDVLRSGNSCWVSVRLPGQDTSYHGDLQLRSKTPLCIEESGGRLQSVKDKTNGISFITFMDTESKWECSFVAPSSVLSSIHKTSVISLDVTDGGLGTSLCKSNYLKIWETSNGNIRRVLDGHTVDAYHCRFFPSGLVILSGGADCCIKIWSAETGECPVTLRGHSGAIQDTAIVERGRNIVSVSKDGTAKLWDCGEARCLATLYSGDSQINTCIILSATKFSMEPPVDNLSDREVLTSGKLLILGAEDGKLVVFNVAARKEFFSTKLSSAVNCLVPTSDNSFAAGCQNGNIYLYHFSDMENPKIIEFATKSPVLDLMCDGSTNSRSIFSLWAAKSDGTCTVLDMGDNSSRKMLQLTGPDCDAVYKIKKDKDFIYTASRDGLIRKYSINLINKLL